MAIEFEKVDFRYRRGQDRVLSRFSFTFKSGRTILLGPNGAGKSTVLGLAASSLQPGDGAVRLDGVPSTGVRSRRRYRAQVGFLPQRVDAAPGVTVREQVALHGWLKGLTRTEAWDAALDALTEVDLGSVADRPSGRISGGQRARMGIAQALVHRATTLLLDEPAASLDPDQRERFAALLAGVCRDKDAIVSTHDVGDIATSYDHVAVLVDGRIRFHDSVEDFLGLASTPVEAYRVATGATSGTSGEAT